jgi:putative membrane protein
MRDDRERRQAHERHLCEDRLELLFAQAHLGCQLGVGGRSLQAGLEVLIVIERAVALLAMWLLRRRYPMPFGSLVLILVFLTLHSIAARWLYSYVPYDAWTHWLFGWSLNDKLGWTRNDFDRLVHIFYGLCLGPVLLRYLADARGWRLRWAALASVDVILSTSALYELFEWGVASLLSPATAEAYNGQQGDMWDAHKDMTCALAASIVAAAIVCGVRIWRRRRATSLPTGYNRPT